MIENDEACERLRALMDDLARETIAIVDSDPAGAGPLGSVEGVRAFLMAHARAGVAMLVSVDDHGREHAMSIYQRSIEEHLTAWRPGPAAGTR